VRSAADFEYEYAKTMVKVIIVEVMNQKRDVKHTGVVTDKDDVVDAVGLFIGMLLHKWQKGCSNLRESVCITHHIVCFVVDCRNVAWDRVFWSDIGDEVGVFNRDAVLVQNYRCDLTSKPLEKSSQWAYLKNPNIGAY